MACCFACFYDTSAMSWEEELLADIIIKAAERAQEQPPVDSIAISERDCLAEVPVEYAGVPRTGGKLRVYDYAPRVFRHLREAACFSNNISHREWVAEWTATKQRPQKGALGGGKSGATFIKSVNNHYMIKTIDKKEVELCRNQLFDYVEHLKRCPKSLLMRNYNLLRVEELAETGKVKMTKYLLVFENIIEVPNNLKIPIQMWDLKGRVPKPGKLPHPSKKPGSMGKDCDLMRDFRLNSQTAKDLVQQLRLDTTYMQQHNLMDYSLFISIAKVSLPLVERKRTALEAASGVTPAHLRTLYAKHAGEVVFRENPQRYHNGVLSHDCTEIYFIGIIDTLTEYHKLKKLANCCKQFAFFEEQLSTIPAEEYGERFYDFMTKVFRDRPRKTHIVGATPSEYEVTNFTG